MWHNTNKHVRNYEINKMKGNFYSIYWESEDFVYSWQNQLNSWKLCAFHRKLWLGLFQPFSGTGGIFSSLGVLSFCFLSSSDVDLHDKCCQSSQTQCEVQELHCYCRRLTICTLSVCSVIVTPVESVTVTHARQSESVTHCVRLDQSSNGLVGSLYRCTLLG